MNDMVKWNSKVVSEHQHRGKDGSWERTEGKDRMGLEELVETCMLMAQYVKFFQCLHSGPNSWLSLLSC